ncbi:MAG: class I tRNA ligase family protein, partial [Candidatus Ranarchaeia archaeon]
ISQRLGLSCNSFELDEITRTDSPSYRSVTQATFIDLWKQGLISEAARPNNWCPVCHTTIADAEVEYKEGSTELNYFAFKIEETGEILEIATTRPELFSACAAILIHPDDDRYRHLAKKHALTPIYNKKVPILQNREAKMDFGSGVMMVCSFGDYTDVRLFRDLKLTPIPAIDSSGKMTEVAGKYAGLSVKEAKKAIIRDARDQGLIIKHEVIQQRTPTCWRSKNPIEFIVMPEFYLKQVEYVEDIRSIADTIEFHPPHNKQILLDWLRSITTDWPISRRRYYGTEIPMWYCKECKTPYVPPPGKYYQPWKNPPPIDICPKCKSKSGFVGETRTFDTWMDSSISCLIAISYLKDPAFFKQAFPCSLRPQGKDIVRTWLNYTLLRVLQLMKKPAFKHVWISGMVLDGKGRAMHKSLGNVVWPEPLLKQFGADAFRMSGASEASVGSDLQFQKEKVQGAFKYLTKYWNIARFTSIFPLPKKVHNRKDLIPTDQWILKELQIRTQLALEGYKKLDFNKPAKIIRNFLWEIHAPHYIEMVKQRAFNRDNTYTSEQQISAQYTLHKTLQVILLLSSPITPFITDKISRELYGQSIHNRSFPTREPLKTSSETKIRTLTQLITSTNSILWKHKQEKGSSLKSPIEEVWLPQQLEPYGLDLDKMHSIGILKFGTPPELGKYISYSILPQKDTLLIYVKKQE